MNNPLELFKSVDRTSIHGTTIINHKARYKLKLSCDEYVLIDLIHKLMIQNKLMTKDRLKRWTGFDVEEARPLFNSLREKKLFESYKDEIDKTRYKVTKRYQIVHKLELDDNYEYFWQKKGNRTWHGSKAAGKKLYKIAADKYGVQYINNQKDSYFNYLSLEGMEWLRIQNVTTFLGTTTERYNEAWNEYAQEHLNKSRIDQPETSNTITSREDVDKSFE